MQELFRKLQKIVWFSCMKTDLLEESWQQRV